MGGVGGAYRRPTQSAHTMLALFRRQQVCARDDNPTHSVSLCNVAIHAGGRAQPTLVQFGTSTHPIPLYCCDTQQHYDMLCNFVPTPVFFFFNSGKYVAYTPDSRNDKRVFDPLSNCCMAFCLNDAYLTDHTRLVTFPELISCQRQAPLRPAKGLVKPCRLCKNGP